MVGTSAKPPAYDAGWSPEFQRAADLALVVEGKEVLASALEVQRAGDMSDEEQQDRRDDTRHASADAGTSGSAASSIQRRLAAPFVGYSLAAARAFLVPVYQPTLTPGELQQQPWKQLLGALRLAHQLDAPRIAILLENAALAKLGVDNTRPKHWMPALSAADGLQQQAPRLYERAVAMAASSLLLGMGSKTLAPLSVKQQLANDMRAKLCPATLVKVLATVSSGVRASTAAASDCQWDAAARSLLTEGEHFGTFTWSWRSRVGGAADDRFARRSPDFNIGGFSWKICAYIVTRTGGDRLSVYLECPQLKHENHRLAVTYSLTVKGRTFGPAQNEFSLARNWWNWGWHEVLTRAELEQPASDLPADGSLDIPITVELTFRRLVVLPLSLPPVPPKERAWVRLARAAQEQCRRALRSLAAMLLRAALLLVAWGACAAAYHRAGWRDEGRLAL
ncbi:hypothetical protein ABPG77_006552 [Micractinium sp. CCAP 211/92]